MKGNYICSVPFTSLEVHDKTSFLCCATWLPKHLPKNATPKECWESKEANQIRGSILDGSYKYCSTEHCPHLNSLEVNKRHPLGPTPLVSKGQLNSKLKSKIENFKNGIIEDPTHIQFSFDRSCNLKCPSCRIELITASSTKIKEVEATITEIENTYSKAIKQLYITGTGDPFTSVGFRKFLQNFKPEKYPKLKNIHLHTNATKWNKKMWNSMPNIHPFVSTCEISIDAATQDTYENKTRLGGKWDELVDNLHFINTLPNLQRIRTSFVVQQSNYKEMKLFRDLIKSIFKEKAIIYFSKLTNWGTFSEEVFNRQKIWSEEHPEFKSFVEELNKTLPSNNTYSNMEEYLYKSKALL